MKPLFAFATALVLAGCYGPNSLDNAEPFYTGEISRPPMEVAECVQARYMLEKNQILTIVRDGDTVVLSHGLNSAYSNLLYFRAFITPGRIEVRSNHPIGYPVQMEWIKGCAT